MVGAAPVGVGVRSRLWVPMGVLVVVGLAALQQELRSGSSSGDRVATAERDEVVRVIDGDTVVLRAAGKSRLMLEAPSYGDSGSPTEAVPPAPGIA
jgi:hypothetical protein